jgi:hypothetical protein
MFKYRKLLGSNKSTPAFSKVPEMISLISHHKGQLELSIKNLFDFRLPSVWEKDFGQKYMLKIGCYPWSMCSQCHINENSSYFDPFWAEQLCILNGTILNWTLPLWAISVSCATMGRPTQWMPALWEQKYLAGVDGSVKRKKYILTLLIVLKKLIF